jgi:hypothetical protein
MDASLRWHDGCGVAAGLFAFSSILTKAAFA